MDELTAATETSAAPRRTGRTLIRAGAIVDARGKRAAPGAILLEDDRIVAAGRPESIGNVAGAGTLDLAGAVVLPALVNAHVHLDLSLSEPVPCGDGFPAWLEQVRASRTDADVASAVRAGAALVRAGGAALVGDIAGTPAAARALAATGLPGVSFLEVFGLGDRQAVAIARMQAEAAALDDVAPHLRIGLGPHAPYSAGPDVHRAAAAARRPVTTHLAESPEEIAFLADGTGPLAAMLARFGVLDASVAIPGVHPVESLADALAARPWLLAHVNHLEPRHADALAAWDATVVVCPRACAHFGRGHENLAVLRAAGVRIALGTDGGPCAPTPRRLDMVEELRALRRAAGVEPTVLLAMATAHGALGLGFDPAPLRLEPGPTAGLLALEVPDGAAPSLAAALDAGGAPRWIAGPFDPWSAG